MDDENERYSGVKLHPGMLHLVRDQVRRSLEEGELVPCQICPGNKGAPAFMVIFENGDGLRKPKSV